MNIRTHTTYNSQVQVILLVVFIATTTLPVSTVAKEQRCSLKFLISVASENTASFTASWPFLETKLQEQFHNLTSSKRASNTSEIIDDCDAE